MNTAQSHSVAIRRKRIVYNLQPWGREFEPPQVHQSVQETTVLGASYMPFSCDVTGLSVLFRLTFEVPHGGSKAVRIAPIRMWL